MFEKMKKKISCNSNSVIPQEEVEEDNNIIVEEGGNLAAVPAISEEEGKQLTDTDTEVLMHKFCANALLLSSISEAVSIFSVGTYLFTVPSNPGALPGSPPMPKLRIIKNTAFMAFGELFVTDGIVTWVSARWKDKYFIDLTQYWMNRDRNVYNAAFLIFATYGIYIIIMFGAGKDGLGMCFTGNIENPDVYAITACPLPPSDISEMSSVGSKFAQLFANATSASNLDWD